MEKLCQSEGIVLRRIDLNDADQIVTALTREHGKISLVAKGSKRLKSKFCGRLEPFYQSTLSYFQGRDLGHLNEAELRKVPKALEMDLKSKSILFYMGEITLKLSAEHQECPEVYDLLEETLSEFDEASSEVILYSYIIKLLSILGFMGSWDVCGRSNEKLNLSEPLYLSLADASIVRRGYVSPGDLRLTPSVIKWVNYMQKEPLSKLKQVAPGSGEKTEVWMVIQSMFGKLLNFPFKSQVFLQSQTPTHSY